MTLRQLSKVQPDSRFFTPGTAYSRFLEEAPYLSRCSDDKTATLIRPRHIAIKYPYMQVNRADFVSWLIFDLDHPNTHIWADVGLPAPNFIVQNRKTGHSHLYYAITPVCTSESARIKPINYMRSVYEAFAIKLKADENYHSGPVAKTPGHPWWITSELHAKVFELGEMADHVDLPKFSFKPKADLDDVAHSRHCILFEKLRHYAYALVADYRSVGYERFLNAVTNYAERLNNFESFGFPVSLPLSSITATAKSVARWTFYKYTGNRKCHRGAMQLDSSLPIKERQKLAAERTATRRKDKTLQAVLNAARTLISSGTTATRTAIATILKISRQTVGTYWAEVEKFLAQAERQPSNPPEQARPAEKNGFVKFGVHQVTAEHGGNTAPFNYAGFSDKNIIPLNPLGSGFKKKAFFKRE